MFKRIFIVFCIVTTNLFAQDKNSRNLVILIDENGETIGTNKDAILQDLLSILHQKTVPALISRSLWQAFIEKRRSFALALSSPGSDENKLVEHYNAFTERMKYWFDLFSTHNNDSIGNTQLALEQVNEELCSEKAIERAKAEKKYVSSKTPFAMFSFYTVPFQASDWLFYKINKDFYLLIPVGYVDLLKEQTVENESIEDLVGLSVDKLTKIEDPLAVHSFYYESYKRESNALIQAFSQLFLPKNGSNEKNEYQWNIYCSGHGLNLEPYASEQFFGKIANLSISEFKEMLQFFEKYVRINFFYYNACYAGGMHLQKAYQTDGVSDLYSYPIIAQATGDVVSLGYGVPQNNAFGTKIAVENIKRDSTGQWRLTFCSEHEWADFFEEFSHAINDEKSNMGQLSHWKIPHYIAPNVWNNMIHIRYAYASQFVPIFSLDYGTKLTYLLVLLKELQNCPITIEKQGIYIDTHSVPVDLLCTKKMLKNFPRFISLSPGESVHHFKKLDASGFYVNDLLAGFAPLRGLCFDKTFLFDELSIANNPSEQFAQCIGADQESVTLNNGIILLQKEDCMRITFMNDKGIPFACQVVGEDGRPCLKDIIALSEDEIESYKAYYNERKEEALQLYEKQDKSSTLRSALRAALSVSAETKEA